MSSFCADIFVPKTYEAITVTREKLPEILLYKKSLDKMLMQLTPVSVTYYLNGPKAQTLPFQKIFIEN